MTTRWREARERFEFGPSIFLSFFLFLWSSGWWACVVLGLLKVYREEDLSLFLFMVPFTLIACLGTTAFLAASSSLMDDVRRARRMLASPNEPWKWRRDWREGFVGTGTTNVSGHWILQGAAVLGSVVLLGVVHVVREPSVAIIPVLLFAAVDAGLFVWGIRTWRSERLFRGTKLHLDRTPFVPGGELKATLVIPRPMKGQAQVVLSCERTWFRKGKRGTQNETLYRRQSNVLVSTGFDSTNLVVTFPVPERVQGGKAGEVEGTWWLRITLGPFSQSFEVPVFDPVAPPEALGATAS